MADDLRTRILTSLARGDGQMIDGFDISHAAEVMYGEQADAIDLLIGQEIVNFANEVSRDLRQDADLTRHQAGSKIQRQATRRAALDLVRAASTCRRRAQERYGRTSLATKVPDWFRPTPEALAALHEERASVEASEVEHHAD